MSAASVPASREAAEGSMEREDLYAAPATAHVAHGDSRLLLASTAQAAPCAPDCGG